MADPSPPLAPVAAASAPPPPPQSPPVPPAPRPPQPSPSQQQRQRRQQHQGGDDNNRDGGRPSSSAADGGSRPGNATNTTNNNATTTTASTPPTTSATPPPTTAPPNRRPPPTARPNVARICGQSASKCGYCKGDRAHVLKEPNPPPAPVSVKGDGRLGGGDGGGGGQAGDGSVGGGGQAMDGPDGPNGKTASSAPSMSESSAMATTSTSAGGQPDPQPTPDPDPDPDPDDPDAQTSSKSYGLLFTHLSPPDYQTLLDTGWRRSGNHLYRPDNFESCCPALSIRLDVGKYRASKSQKKVGRLLRECFDGDGKDESESKSAASSSSALGANGSKASNDAAGSSGQGRRKEKKPRWSGSPKSLGGGAGGGTTAATETAASSSSSGVDPVNRRRQKQSSKQQGGGGKGAIEESEQANKLLLETSGVLDRLRDATQTAIRTALASMSESDGKDDDEKLLAKLCTYRLSKSIPKQEEAAAIAQAGAASTTQDHIQRVLLVSTSACAAMSGRSKGRIDRGELCSVASDLIRQALALAATGADGADDGVSASVVASSANSFPMNATAAAEEEVADSRSDGGNGSGAAASATTAAGSGSSAATATEHQLEGAANSVQVLSVQPHAKSGRINVYLGVVVVSSTSGRDDEGTESKADDDRVVGNGVLGGDGDGESMEVDDDGPVAVDGEVLPASSSPSPSSSQQQQQQQMNGGAGVAAAGRAANGNAGRDKGGATTTASTAGTARQKKQKKKARQTFLRRKAERTSVIDEFLGLTTNSSNVDGNGSGGGTLRHHHTLTVRSVPAHISAGQPDVHCLFAKYQTAIHGDPDPFAPPTPPQQKGEGEGSDESGSDGSKMKQDGDEDADMTDDGYEGDRGAVGGSMDDDEDDDEAWKRDCYDMEAEYPNLDIKSRERLREAYASFHRFLCETPLPPPPTPQQQQQPQMPDDDSNNDNSGSGDPFRIDPDGYDVHIPYGTYHQQYRIDGKHLIAVGVVDVLPRSLSSVYAFYDPTLSIKLNLGKYTALREIEWVRRASRYRYRSSSSRRLRGEGEEELLLDHYYLGYYIHSCQKMRYKAEYRPSELLCPTHCVWVDFEVAKERLDRLSPVRHCCTLYDGDGDREGASNADKKKSGDSDATPAAAVRGGGGGGGGVAKESYTDEDKMAFAESILLDIGAGEGQAVTVGMLNRHGRAIVDPLVKEFVDEVGVDVSRRCVLKLC